MLTKTLSLLLVTSLPTVLPAQNAGCDAESLRNISTSIDDDKLTRVKWESRNCKGKMEIRGSARIAGDLSGFASISPGSTVIIETEGNDGDRKLTLTPSGDRFAYQYEIGGDRKAWDGDGQRWLASVITLLVRRAGFGAEERVDYLLRERGVSGVLDEVRAMESDYTQRKYLNLLLNKTTLNGGAVRTVIDLGARELQSDYELTQLLMAVSKRYELSNESREAFIRATGTLESDYERRRALSVVLSRGSLSRDDVVAVLDATAEMDSDYERAQVLKQVSAQSDFADNRLQQSYLKSAAGMQSDYERRQVLTALVKRGKLEPAAVDVVLTAASSFNSDYERAELLTLLLQTQSLTQAQKSRMVKLIDEIQSDHERGKVASLMLKQLNTN
jgi:hypothetical protein